jgi:hypothetical protein
MTQQRKTIQRSARAWRVKSCTSDIAAACAWRRSQCVGGSTRLARQQAESDLMRERALLVRMERERREGKVHDVPACEAARTRQLFAFKSALLGIPREAAGSLVGLSVEAIERDLCRRFNDALGELTDGMGSGN